MLLFLSHKKAWRASFLMENSGVPMTRSCPRQGKVAPLGDERGSLPRSRAAVVWFSFRLKLIVCFSDPADAPLKWLEILKCQWSLINTGFIGIKNTTKCPISLNKRHIIGVIGQNVLVKIYIMLVLRAEYGAYWNTPELHCNPSHHN